MLGFTPNSFFSLSSPPLNLLTVTFKVYLMSVHFSMINILAQTTTVSLLDFHHSLVNNMHPASSSVLFLGQLAFAEHIQIKETVEMSPPNATKAIRSRLLPTVLMLFNEKYLAVA